MRFLVIGGAGFIGSHLVDYLSTKGDVTVFDNLSTGRMSNINLKKNKVKVTSVRLHNEIQDTDYVYCLAGSVGVDYFTKNAKDSIINNLFMAMDISKACEYYNKPVLFTSTSEIYGNSTMLPFKEDQDACIGTTNEVRWGYSCSKLMSEFILKSSNVNSVIVRPFNIVGERQVSDYGMVIPTFIEKALKNEDIVIHGDGRQVRCFCYIKDIIEPLYLLLLDSTNHNHVYNVGNPNNIVMIRELAELIINATKSKSKIVYKDERNSVDVYVRVPSIEFIKEKIGWEPKTRIEEIINRCVQSYRK